MPPSNTPSTQRLRSLALDDRGLSAVEYVVLLAFIAVAGIGSWRIFGETIVRKIHETSAAVRDMDDEDEDDMDQGNRGQSNSGKPAQTQTPSGGSAQAKGKLDD